MSNLITEVIGPFEGEHAYLSNFYKSHVFYEDMFYPTSEHAFQAAKTIDLKRRVEFQNPRLTPGSAKRMGRKLDIRPNWDDIKVTIMTDIVKNKFLCNTLLSLKLIETGEAKLVEINTWNDKYWGVCNDVGENYLGRILMYVRGLLKNDRMWKDQLKEMANAPHEIKALKQLLNFDSLTKENW